MYPQALTPRTNTQNSRYLCPRYIYIIGGGEIDKSLLFEGRGKVLYFDVNF